MIKLTKLCNKRRIEDERTPFENDFSVAVNFPLENLTPLD